MSDRAVKKERSPTPELSTYVSATSAIVGSPGSPMESEDVKPPHSQPQLDHIMKEDEGDSVSEISLLAAEPLTRENWLSYLGRPAMATERVNKAANASTITTSITTTPGRAEQHLGLADTHLSEDSTNIMANQGFEEGFSLFPPTALSSPDPFVGDSVVSRGELEQLQNDVHHLSNVSAASQDQLATHDTAIREMATFSQKSHAYMQQLTTRIMQLEAENTKVAPVVLENSSSRVPQSSYLADQRQQLPSSGGFTQYRDDADDHSRSPSPVAHRYRNREERSIGAARDSTLSGRVKKVRARKQLSITIPSSLIAPTVGVGIPTPVTKSAASIPSGTFEAPSSLSTPITPGRIGPLNFNNRSKPRTRRVSRGQHNLDKTMAPIYAQVPLVPLTDTEVIVYFFQSLSRPLVSLRLYSRNWGPASIVDALNGHRLIEPEYLRNTCSVKCTTAIKRGKEMYGDEWEGTYHDIFKTADDLKATDLIRLSPEEIQNTRDFEIRQLCVGLKKHPLDGVDGGIFTRCVKYCEENDADYTLENVWKLAADLQAGRLPVPTGPVSELDVENSVVAEAEPDEVEKCSPSLESKAMESPGSNASGLSTPLDSVLYGNLTGEVDEST